MKKRRKWAAPNTEVTRGQRKGYLAGGATVTERMVITMQPSSEITMEAFSKSSEVVGGSDGIGDWGRRGSTALGRRSERLFIKVRWRMERATEGRRRPSLMRRGSIEKVATVMNHGRVIRRLGASPYNSTAGTTVKRIDFSCTWKENRKNTRAVEVRERTRLEMVGLAIKCRLLGRARRRVTAPLSLANSGMLKLFRNFTTTSSEHQKLATLSSKSPRPKGKHLFTT